jgi:DHA1 family bicyclomycin/chloramphenicol resistance-like MFS transporter
VATALVARRPSVRDTVVLGLLSTFGPISLDLYLPLLPQLAGDLHASPSAAQATITACLLGLAAGQLVAGPLSDRIGRKRPLITGVALYAICSLLCAVAPTISVLLALRLLQGLAGAAGLVIARAVARDLFGGRALVVFLARMMLVSGFAPVVAPVLGGQLARVMDWRGVFGVLAAIGLVLVLAALLGLPESLPPERRVGGRWHETLRGFPDLLRDRLFVGVALSGGLAGASMFAYIAGATFVLQRQYGLSPQGFSFVFGLNSIGIMAFSQVAARLVRTTTPHRVLALGLSLNLTGAMALLLSVLTHAPLPFIICSLFVMVSSLGTVFPTTTAIALSGHGNRAGTASSLLGLLQYVFGAAVAPLVGIAGEDTAIPLGVVAASASTAAMVVFLGAVRRRLAHRGLG